MVSVAWGDKLNMKQVDFYLISNQVADAKYKLASRLSNKLQRFDKKVLVVTANQDSIDILDRIMWSFSDTSFLAHEQVEADQTSLAKLQIMHSKKADPDQLQGGFEVLINLSDEIPVFRHNFDRIAEIVEVDEPSKAAARIRFNAYKQEGFEIKTHSIEL